MSTTPNLGLNLIDEGQCIDDALINTNMQILSNTANLDLEMIQEGTPVDNDLFNRNFQKIDEAWLNTSDATAGPSQILSGYSAYANKAKITGAMPNNGSQSANLNCSQSKTIPAGYTSGGTVTANSLASQTSATAVAADIKSGKTAWVNGSKITGTGSSGPTQTPARITVTYYGSDQGYVHYQERGTDTYPNAGYFTYGDRMTLNTYVGAIVFCQICGTGKPWVQNYSGCSKIGPDSSYRSSNAVVVTSTSASVTFQEY